MNDIRQALAVGKAELRKARRNSAGLLGSAILFSVFVNLLMLTGPLFMLQVYDRVLSSRSEETLVALFVLVAFLFLLMAVLDYARGRVTARIGAKLQKNLDSRIFSAMMKRAQIRKDGFDSGNALRHLDALQSFYSSPGILAMLDVPWTPLFFAAIFIFHPSLGMLALGGGGFLVLLTIINQLITFRKVRESQISSEIAHSFAAEVRAASEIVKSQGMQTAVTKRLEQKRSEALSQSMFASDWTGSFSSLIKASRLFLQSAMLGVGAFLVLKGELTAGAMIAGSILLGRALAPVEQLMGQWTMLQRARSGWQALAKILAATPEDLPKIKLPAPKALLTISAISVYPVGEKKPTLRNVSFRLEPGHALGVIGRSGSGKSTLAKAILGIQPVASGEVRLSGATLDQYAQEDLGQYIGYLPQSVTLFNGTITENIARMSLEPDTDAVIKAAEKANAHNMITRLPEGYNTYINGNNSILSGGEMQRIALARALYGDPVILILDEPNSALDTDGSNALNACVLGLKKEGKSVVIMTHRPAAITECDLLMILDNGAVTAFGPAEETMKSMLKNATDVQRSVRNRPAAE